MKYLFFLVLIFFVGCSTQTKHIDNQKILTTTCKKCHSISMPPKINNPELAPPMMAVVFHLKDFIKTSNPSDHKAKFSQFVADYLINPAKSKSYCDKSSLKKYGVMPSLKGSITDDEAISIANYIYDKYDPQKFYKMQKEEAEFKALPLGEQIARKNSCLSCHGIKKAKIAPSFITIAKNSTKQEIRKTLLNGSKGKYKGFEKSYMPPLGKTINDNELNIIIQWIISLKKI